MTCVGCAPDAPLGSAAPWSGTAVLAGGDAARITSSDASTYRSFCSIIEIVVFALSSPAFAAGGLGSVGGGGHMLASAQGDVRCPATAALHIVSRIIVGSQAYHTPSG